MRTTDLYSNGYLSVPDAAVQVRETIGDPHSGSGGRALHISLAGGLSFEVLLDRGLDIGSAWFQGRPLAWRSPLAMPDQAPGPDGWLGRFGGGLLTTCGLDNIGAPRGRYGQHGSHHDRRASDVTWYRTADRGAGAPGIVVFGSVDSVEVFGRTVRLRRQIVAECDSPTIEIRDEIVNEGYRSEEVPILYHCNFGAPVVMPGSAIDIPARDHLCRADHPLIPQWSRYSDPIEELEEQVWIHEGFEGGVRTSATVTSPEGLSGFVEWDPAELPACVEWQFPARGRWVLGLEPGNCRIFDPSGVLETTPYPILEPGESWSKTVVIGARSL